jgi:hypothetical protein
MLWATGVPGCSGLPGWSFVTGWVACAPAGHAQRFADAVRRARFRADRACARATRVEPRRARGAGKRHFDAPRARALPEPTDGGVDANRNESKHRAAHQHCHGQRSRPRPPQRLGKPPRLFHHDHDKPSLRRTARCPGWHLRSAVGLLAGRQNLAAARSTPASLFRRGPARGRSPIRRARCPRPAGRLRPRARPRPAL